MNMGISDNDKAAIEGAAQNLAPALATSLATVLGTIGILQNPIWPILFTSAHGLFSYYLYYKQERLSAFVRWIKAHPNEFSEELIQQPAFQQGFFPTLEAFLRARSEKKMKLIQQIFLGFAETEDKEEFELERFYEIIKLISAPQIELLSSLNKDGKDTVLFEGGGLNGSYHKNYQLIRSLEALGIVIVHTDVDIINRHRHDGDWDDMLTENQTEATSKKYETAELTDFGRNFIAYLEKSDL